MTPTTEDVGHHLGNMVFYLSGKRMKPFQTQVVTVIHGKQDVVLIAATESVKSLGF